MRVSVIIPALNEGPRIASAIQSARMAGAHEIHVVDGGSRDDTSQIAHSSGANVIQSAPGRARQMNAGAQIASGDVFLFLHADCQLDPTAITQIRQTLATAPACWGGFRQRIEEPGMLYRFLEAGNAYRILWRGSVYGDQGIFVKRESFFRWGQFPQEPILEDLLFSQTARREVWPCLLPGPLRVSARRWKSRGPIRQTLRNWKILAAHAWGYSPAQLAPLYRSHDHME